MVAGNVNSTTHHHHKQEIWLEIDGGGEECIKLKNIDFEGRHGHKIKVIKNARTGTLERIANEDLGKYWNAGNRAVSPLNSYFLIGSLISSLPIVNIVFSFLSQKIWISELFSEQFSGSKKKRAWFVALSFISSFCLLSYLSIENNLFTPKASYTVSEDFQSELYAPLMKAMNYVASEYRDSAVITDLQAEQQRNAEEFKRKYGEVKYSPKFEARRQKRIDTLLNGTPQEQAREAFRLRDKKYSLPVGSGGYLKPLYIAWALSFVFYFLILNNVVVRYNLYCAWLDQLCLTKPSI